MRGSISFIEPSKVTEPALEVGEVFFDAMDSDCSTSDDEQPEEITPATQTEQETTDVVIDIDPLVVETVPPATEVEENLGRGLRSKLPSTRLRDYVVNTVTLAPTLSLSLSLINFIFPTAVFRYGLSPV